MRAGDTDLNKDRTDQIYQDVSVEKIIRHPEYNSNNHYDDIALLILKEEFEITSNVGIVCVPNQDHAFDNEKCWVSGFGANEQRGKFEKRLLKVEIPVVPNPVCQRLLRNSNLGPWFILSQKLICAGGEGLYF